MKFNKVLIVVMVSLNYGTTDKNFYVPSSSNYRSWRCKKGELEDKNNLKEGIFK